MLHFIAELLSPLAWSTILLPVLLFLPVALTLAQHWRSSVDFRWPELLLAPIPTAAWTFLSLIPGGWHHDKTWGNLLELPALGLLSIPYVFLRRQYCRRALPRWGYAAVALIGIAAGFACLRFIPTATFIRE